MLVSYGSKLHMLPASYYLAAHQEPHKEPLYLTKNAGEFSGKKFTTGPLAENDRTER